MVDFSKTMTDKERNLTAKKGEYHDEEVKRIVVSVRKASPPKVDPPVDKDNLKIVKEKSRMKEKYKNVITNETETV